MRRSVLYIDQLPSDIVLKEWKGILISYLWTTTVQAATIIGVGEVGRNWGVGVGGVIFWHLKHVMVLKTTLQIYLRHIKSLPVYKICNKKTHEIHMYLFYLLFSIIWILNRKHITNHHYDDVVVSFISSLKKLTGGSLGVWGRRAEDSILYT